MKTARIGKLARVDYGNCLSPLKPTNSAAEACHEESPPGSMDCAELARQLVALRNSLLEAEASHASRLEQLDERHLASARNLLHYLALRQQDLRSLQELLSENGLSSLGQCESHVLATVNAVLRIVTASGGGAGPSQCGAIEAPVTCAQGRDLIVRATESLFGFLPAHAGAHIMVTMPGEAADDYELVRELLRNGMDCQRINCAHDDRVAWARMIEHLRRAMVETGRPCRILMDLGGPKLRTGAIAPGPRVVKVRPRRDKLGRIVDPARVWLAPAGAAEACPEAPGPADAELPLIDAPWREAVPGDRVEFRDSRGRRRSMRVVETTPRGLWAETRRTAYVVAGTPLTLRARDGEHRRPCGRIGLIAPLKQCLCLRRGDHLWLTDDDRLGTPPEYDDSGRLTRPAAIGCTLSQVLDDVRPGDRILFDDGKIAGVALERCADHVLIEILSESGRLSADKGINFPDSRLRLDSLTAKDRQDLEFVAQQADMIGYSFVRRPEDIEQLRQELARLGKPELGIVLKIENREAFERLPSLLLTVMRSPACGVMIARGDLAVEMGWQRLAEVQEEILWMCEAAHLPVVWATQVLEKLTKEGTPTRAEITDAAMGVRAECVMLNKGRHVVDAVRVLSDILRRMQDHQVKKRPLLRRLRLADDLTRVDGRLAASS